MEQLELRKILNLVGELKDSEKENSASSRFRENFIEEIEGINTIKNYVQECLENKGIQYARALQDLVNHVGTLLGFRVKYGRYSGKSNKIGYDGLWKSPTGKKFIVETKSSNDFAIRTGQILGYKNELISEKNYKKNNMLGIFVLGSKDEKSEQLKNAIIGEERDKELRIIHIRPLLNLLEIKQRYNVTHQSILSILLPSGPQIDPYVELMSNLLTQESQENIDEKEFKQDSEMAEKPGAEIDKKKEIDDYTGLKPQAFLFKEKKVEVKKWKEIIIKLSEEIKINILKNLIKC